MLYTIKKIHDSLTASSICNPPKVMLNMFFIFVVIIIAVFILCLAIQIAVLSLYKEVSGAGVFYNFLNDVLCDLALIFR